MAVFALASVKASPGVTTSLLALAAVWPEERPLLLVDADPDGGDLAARLGLPVEPGMASLAAAGRRSLHRGDLDRHLQTIPGGVPALVGNPDPDQAARELGLVGERLADVLSAHPGDVLVDCGRLRSNSPALPLAGMADELLLFSRPRIDELQHVSPRVGRISSQAPRVALVLVGERPYAANDVRDAVRWEVLGVIADDPRAAAAFTGHGGRPAGLTRSLLLRSARSLTDRLTARVAVSQPAVEPATGLRPPGSDTPGASDVSVSAGERTTASPWADRIAGNGRPS